MYEGMEFNSCEKKEGGIWGKYVTESVEKVGGNCGGASA